MPLITDKLTQPIDYKMNNLMTAKPEKYLEIFENPNTERDYTIHISIPEFTCLCPKTGQPDFATITLDYIPDNTCVELKSLKLYIGSFRDKGTFHEAVTNQMRDDIVAITCPRYLRLTAEFNVRGGIYTTVVADYQQDQWQSKPPIHLP